METPVNRFKQRLMSRQPQIGLWLALADPACAEICAGAGFDWVLLDGEHAPNDIRSLFAQLQAVAPYASDAVVRVPIGDTTIIKQVKDIGAQTVLVPVVESAEQAQLLSRAMRYPPAGIRGVGSSIVRASRWNAIPNYLRDADAQACLIVQLETAAALRNLEGICAVDGVDGVFIGPSDLAASLGHRGDPGHADVQSAIEGAIARIQAAGKPAGILTANETLARRYLQLGCTFVAVGVDTTLLAGSARALAQRFLGKTDSSVRTKSDGYS
jgi:4-hydroxy-2-oxoheptanedioate aldolase